MKMKIIGAIITTLFWLFIGHIGTRIYYEFLLTPTPISEICRLEDERARYEKWWLEERRNRQTFEENFYKELCK